MSIQEKSKENPSNVIKKSDDKNLEAQIQDSQKNLAKKSNPKEAIKSLVKFSNESKINQPELGICMSTRSATAAFNDEKANKSINRNVATVKRDSQQESTKKKKSQKKSVHETPKSNEQLNRRSQRLQQLTEVSTRSLRSREIQGQVQAVKLSLPPTRKEHCSNTQSKSNKVKITQKHVKRKVLEIKSDSRVDENPVINNEVVNSPKGKKRKVEHQTAYACSSQYVKGSENCLQKNTRKEETKSVPVTSEIKRSKMVTIVVSKKNEMKKSVHSQVNTSSKPQKSPQPSVPEQSVDNEQGGKTKRGSILQLCEEIAGEIESDTVEVKKESSQTESVKEEKPTEIKSEQTGIERQILDQKETNQDVQCSRFFPSRKTKPVKCILNGINSSAKKNSNWTKIKLSKFNSVQQNKLDFQVSPKLGLLRTSFTLSALEMPHPVTQSTFLGTKPRDDKNVTCQQEEMKEVNSEVVKTSDITVEMNKTTKSAPENCHLDNQIKPSPDSPLDNQMKDYLESTPDKVIYFYYTQ